MTPEQTEIIALREEVSRLKAEAVRLAIYQAEKDRIEQEYQRSQNRFRTVFERSAVGKKIINDKLEIIKVNQALLNILGYTESEVLGRRITEFAHPKFVRYWKILQIGIWNTNLPSFNFETCLIKKDGSTIWVHVTTIQIEDGGNVLGYTIIEDISERKELERIKDLVRERERRKEIVETIFNTQEKERMRIAESLHNGLAQLLYGVKLHLNLLEPQGSTDAALDNALKYTQELVTDCIKECRGIAHALMPALLDEHGLKNAIIDICKQLNGDVRFDYEIEGLHQRLDKFLEVGIYRIIQELAMNVVKHAQATHATVNLTELDTSVQLEVKDNGKGFEATKLQNEGIGLQTIRYKVELLNGKLQIVSGSGNGTTVSIAIPKLVH